MTYSFNKNKVLFNEGAYLKDDNIMFKYTLEDQLIDDSVSWRGAQGQHKIVHQMLLNH